MSALMDPVASVMIEEQHEKLRRFVDDWRGEVLGKLECGWREECRGALNELWNVASDPLRISTEPRESTSSIVDTTNNVLFNKIVTVLAYDCSEIELLCDQVYKCFYPRLLTFGLPVGPEEIVLEGKPQKMFSQSLMFFHNVSEFIIRLRGLMKNLMQQLGAIYTGDTKSRPHISIANVHLLTPVSYLADGLGSLLIIDKIVERNSAIGHSMTLFLRMLHMVKSETGRFEIEKEKAESLEQLVVRIQEIVQSGLFQTCLHEDFISHPEMVGLRSNRQFLDEILFCVRESLHKILSRLDTLKERPKDRMQMIGLLAVFVLHSWLSVENPPEKKMGKILLEIAGRTPLLQTYGDITIQPMEFLMSHLPPWLLSWSFIKVAQKEAASIRNNFLMALDDSLVRDIQMIQSALAGWMVSINSFFSHMAHQSALRVQMRKLSEGVHLANKLQQILRSTIELHATLEIPIKKDKLMYLYQAGALLKAVENAFHRSSNSISQRIFHIIQVLQAQIEKRLLPVRATLEAEILGNSKTSGFSLLTRSLTFGARDTNKKLSDSLAAVNLVLGMLEGCASVKRRTIIKVALDILNSSLHLQEGDKERISNLVADIDLAAGINAYVEMATDCSFLYWRREMMLAWFSIVYNQAARACQIQLVIDAFNDGVKFLKKGYAEDLVIAAYEQEMETALTNEVIKPLCKDIETDLRLHIHSAHVKGAVTVNPTKTGVRDLSWFLHLKPLRLASKYIHIRARVETYLSSAFYNHVAMALHNYKTYSEMRHLAELKYNLELDHIDLPGQTLNQGVDVLEIMKNIHIFVSCYTYNLNTQVFIEKISNARNRKYLNTISLKHASNSIRTHGIGIMSTSVNFTYQFLVKKLVVFSQFLFDDHIKSRLVKERRFWKDCSSSACEQNWSTFFNIHTKKRNRLSVKQLERLVYCRENLRMMEKYKSNVGGLRQVSKAESKEYPVLRAEKLNKDIKKLGLSDGGLSFLDQFRQLITEIGNALGFVRMIRSGGLHHSSIASGFVQDARRNNRYEEAASEFCLNPETVEAGRILDKALECQDMPVDQTDYFSILTAVFSEELRSDNNYHLQDFYLIVPGLILNAVEFLLHSKEKILKRGRDITNALLTDDGLSLGIAYILWVLNLDKEFDSMHWFDAARKHFTKEKARVQASLDMDNIGGGLSGLQVWSQTLALISEEDAQNMLTDIKRLNNYLTELEMMEYTLTAARAFFK